MPGHSDRLANFRKETCIPSEVEALARELFKSAYRNETFDDLKRRAAFNQQDAGRLTHWIRAAQAKMVEAPAASELQ